jgi:ketosteroid isomerase-like protein
VPLAADVESGRLCNSLTRKRKRVFPDTLDKARRDTLRAMSQENVDIVRRSTELWNAGDVEGLRELFHPDVVLHIAEGLPEKGPFSGVDEVIKQYRRMGEDFTQHHLESTDSEARGDWVIVRYCWTVRGDYSGIEGELRYTGVFRLRTGKIIEVRYCWDHAEALAATGLSEQDAHVDS